MEFKESRTYINLLKAYDKELMHSAKYRVYEEIARLNGFIEISKIFATIADQDRQHASTWLRKINQGTMPSTADNLISSANQENDIARNDYQEYVEVAREEGFNDIAALFAGVANIDYNHAILFQQKYNNIITNQIFCKPKETIWICMQCGNVMSGICAPKICPVCGFPQGYYRTQDNYIY